MGVNNSMRSLHPRVKSGLLRGPEIRFQTLFSVMMCIRHSGVNLYNFYDTNMSNVILVSYKG